MTSTLNKTDTKKFDALLAVLGPKDAAVAWNTANPNKQVAVETPAAVSAEVAQLVEAGFSVEEAAQYVAQAEAPAAPITSQELADVEVAKQGFVPVRGRVYSNKDLIEAQVRVLKHGKPEVVRLAGEHRVKAVVLWRTDNGENVACQNLGVPN